MTISALTRYCYLPDTRAIGFIVYRLKFQTKKNVYKKHITEYDSIVLTLSVVGNYANIHCVPQKNEACVILNILHSCKSVVMKVSMWYPDDLSYKMRT